MARLSLATLFPDCPVVSVNSVGSGPGMGFGLGYSVVLDRAVAHTSDSEGAVSWGGAFGTLFWIDPAEEMVAIILTQVRPYSHIKIREGFHNVVNQAIVD